MLAVLAAPVQAQLVIPSTTGQISCTEGGLSELRANMVNIPSTVENSIAVTTASISAVTFSAFIGIAVPDEGLTLSLRVMKNESGDSAAAETQSLGTLTRDNPIMPQTTTFSNLDKSARYVVELIAGSQTASRRCFKTRGEFTNAEQNLQPDGSADLTKFSRTGCFAVARTRQDIADCMCNGRRNGTLILAGQTTGSQEARRHWRCPNLDS